MSMKIIKRSGEEQLFDAGKIRNAISKANGSVALGSQIPGNMVPVLTAKVVAECENIPHTLGVEEIQDIVENTLMDSGYHDVARSYITYRYTHNVMRGNTTDEKILTLINGVNEEAKQENSNKNPTVVSVQRDYMAGEVSRDITERLLLPEDIVKAHKEGIIHFHEKIVA